MGEIGQERWGWGTGEKGVSLPASCVPLSQIQGRLSHWDKPETTSASLWSRLDCWKVPLDNQDNASGQGDRWLVWIWCAKGSLYL